MAPRMQAKTYFAMDVTAMPKKEDPCYREKWMWAACLNEAVECLDGRAVAVHGKRYRVDQAKQEKRWFKSKATKIGSFLWICKALDLDPKYIRRLYGL